MRIARKKIVAVVALLVFVGCASTKINYSKEDFTGDTIYSTDSFSLMKYAARKVVWKRGKKETTNPTTSVKISAKKVVRRGKAATYTIRIRANSTRKEWLNIRKENSLLFDIDGKRLSFSTKDRSADNRLTSRWTSPSTGIESVSMFEIVHYDNISEHIFRKITNGEVIKVRVAGGHRNEDGYLVGKVKIAFANLISSSAK